MKTTLGVLSAVPFAAILMLCACSSASPAEGESEEVATTTQALQISPGATFSWVRYGSPNLAKRIAATVNGTVYALNEDGNIYAGTGTDYEWSHVGSASEAADLTTTDDGARLWVINKPGPYWWTAAPLKRAALRPSQPHSVRGLRPEPGLHDLADGRGYGAALPVAALARYAVRRRIAQVFAPNKTGSELRI